jgi:multiple sugar transport system substrate-binding protein
MVNTPRRTTFSIEQRGFIRKPFIYLTIIVAVLLLATACTIDLANPPRLATATARAAATVTPLPSPLILTAPTSTPGPIDVPVAAISDAGESDIAGGVVPQLTVWVNEVSPEHRQIADEMATEFAALSGVDVSIQLVSPASLPQLVQTAVVSDTLPDIILHPIEYTAGWVERGILDPAAAEAGVAQLGRETFDPAALELASSGERLSAIPVDGYYQLILYRTDWFRERGLLVPDTFTAMQAAAARINDREAVISGLIIPTESNLVTTHKAFEQMALANNCQLIDQAGEVTLLTPACEQALRQYFSTINQYSPPGVQTDTSARRAYLEGRTGIIMTSPAILPDLAGLNPEAQPSCPTCNVGDDGLNSLAINTGILTTIRGNGINAQPAAFGNIRNMGITTVADREVAQAFIDYWFTEGYEKWLSVDSERKVPMRLGSEESSRQFVDEWGKKPLGSHGFSLVDIYGEETVGRLRDGIADAPRWGIREGHGSLVTDLYEELTFSIVLQEMLSGYFNPETTLREAYRRVIDLIPNYAFPVTIEQETSP